MAEASGGNILFYGGIAVMAAALAAFLIAMVCLRSSKKKLDRQLTQEFGKKRH